MTRNSQTSNLVKTFGFTFHAEDSARIVGDICWCEDNHVEKTAAPVVILLHGWKGFKDWGFFPYAAEKIAVAVDEQNSLVAACVVTFNFSFNGMREGSDIVSEPEDFARNTLSRELNETLRVIEEVTTNQLSFTQAFTRWNGQIVLVGHSRGGGIALLASARSPIVTRVITWASVATFIRYTERQKQKWRARGYTEIEHQRTRQVLRMNVGFLDDLEKNADQLNPQKAIAELSIPTLIIHGKVDVTVNPREAQKLLDSSHHELTSLKLINHAGHTFGVVHPFGGTTVEFEEVLFATIDFIKKERPAQP